MLISLRTSGFWWPPATYSLPLERESRDLPKEFSDRSALLTARECLLKSLESRRRPSSLYLSSKVPACITFDGFDGTKLRPPFSEPKKRDVPKVGRQRAYLLAPASGGVPEAPFDSWTTGRRSWVPGIGVLALIRLTPRARFGVSLTVPVPGFDLNLKSGILVDED